MIVPEANAGNTTAPNMNVIMRKLKKILMYFFIYVFTPRHDPRSDPNCGRITTGQAIAPAKLGHASGLVTRVLPRKPRIKDS